MPWSMMLQFTPTGAITAGIPRAMYCSPLRPHLPLVQGLSGNGISPMSNSDIVEGDAQSYERMHNAVRGCDAVLHQAALPSVPRSIADPWTT